MGSEWKKVTWGDIATLEYGKGLRDYQDATGDFRVFGTNGPIGWHNEPLCTFPSVIVGRKGAYRGIHFSPEPFFVIDTAFYLKPKKDFDIKWAYYELLTHDINSMDSGSAIPSTSRDSFYTLPVQVPSKDEQKAIAHVLGSLDDRIDLNRRMNETLEAMAQALFKSWFVDFDPVIDNALASGKEVPEELAGRAAARAALGDKRKPLPAEIRALFPDEFVYSDEMGWIPKGWEVKSLDSIARYQNGLALQKFRPENEEYFLPVVKIAQLRAGKATVEEKASPNIDPACIIDNGDVIFSWSGSLMVDVWCGGEAALNQHLFKVTSFKYPKWFYYYWTKYHLLYFQRIASDKAVTMGHIKRGHLKEAFCAVPDIDLVGVDNIEKLLSKQIDLRLNSNFLSDLRDTLLPKLLSGELRIPDAEKLAAEVL